MDKLGEVPKSRCSVHDGKGNHCPETPTETVWIDGEPHQLCTRCAINLADGAYGISKETTGELCGCGRPIEPDHVIMCKACQEKEKRYKPTEHLANKGGEND